MKLRIVSLISCVCLMALVLCSCDIGLKNKEDQANVSDVELFDFTLDEGSDTYSVSAKEGVELPEKIVLPSVYEGKAVTAVKSHGFELSEVATVVLSSSYKVIGASAFADCSALKSVTLGGVTDIKNNAFNNCKSLRQIDFPKALKNIGKFAFANTSVYKAAFASVEKIDANAFYNCKALKDVSIPSTTSFIAEDAFDGCSSARFTISEDNAVYTVSDNVIVSK